MSKIKELCAEHTRLKSDDVAILEAMADCLPVIANLTASDVFIGTLTLNGRDSVVAAWAPRRKNHFIVIMWWGSLP